MADDVPVLTLPRRPSEPEVVDAQFHLRAEADQAIAAMDAIGVDAAVVDVWPPDTHTAAHGALRYDNDLAEAARARHPGRFAYVARVDSDDPDLDDVMGTVAASEGAVCVRIAD